MPTGIPAMNHDCTSDSHSKSNTKSYLNRDLDCDPEDVPFYMGNSFFLTKKRITLFFIVQSLLHCDTPNICIKIIQIVIFECFHGTKFLDRDHDLMNQIMIQIIILRVNEL